MAPGRVDQKPLQKASEGGWGIAEPKRYHFKLAQTLAKGGLGECLQCQFLQPVITAEVSQPDFQAWVPALVIVEVKTLSLFFSVAANMATKTVQYCSLDGRQLNHSSGYRSENLQTSAWPYPTGWGRWLNEVDRQCLLLGDTSV